MLRAASLPGQTLSRLALRVQAVPCRLPQTRRVHLSHPGETDEPRKHPDPVPFPLPGHVHLGRFQNGTSASVRERDPPNTSGMQQLHGFGTIEGAHDSAHHFPALDHPPSRSSSTDGLPPPQTVELSTLTPDLERMRSERDVMEAWEIYQRLQKPLANVNRSGGDRILLYTSLHHLIQLLSATTPRSEVLCSRIISAMSTLRRVGGGIRRMQRQLLRVIVKEQKIHPQSLEHLKDLIVDTLPPAADPGGSNTASPTPVSPSEDEHSSPPGIPPQDLSEVDPSEEFQSPILVAPIPTTFTQDHERARLLNVIGTQSFNEAWDAYRAFSSHPLAEDPTLNKYPSRHLHRLVSLLATIRPRTRKVYLSLVSIMSTLRASGHLIYPWEWNLLMDASAKGWRKTRFEDYKTSLQVFNDMLAYQKEVQESNGSQHIDRNVRSSSHDEESIVARNNLAPDIYSYTTLISHGARTLSPQALKHARSLLDSSGIIPNRVTLLAQLHLHTNHNQMFGVRNTIAEVLDRGFTLDICGVNSIIWAFARNEHMEVAEAIYRVLRSNIDADGPVDEEIATTAKFLGEVENIVIPPTVIPDRITYTTLIQSYAYQGDLTRTLQVFADMLSSPDPVAIWRGEVGAKARFLPAMPIFRAIFLGFCRHGVDTARPFVHHRHDRPRRTRGPDVDWNLDNLCAIYNGFLELPADRKPEDRVVYWLIKAFERCSGGDCWRMREVWTTLEERWGDRWGSRLRRVRRTTYHNTEHAEVGSIGDALEDERVRLQARPSTQ